MDQKIPEQHTGTSVDEVCSKAFITSEEAFNFYKKVKQRLLSVNEWEKFAQNNSAAFQLYGKDKLPADRLPVEGDFFRISIPGPDNPSGGGDDWVQVKKIHEEESDNTACITITVMPVSCPLNNDDDVAHFFTAEASSTFIARYENNEVFAEVHGRNEKPNIQDVDMNDKLRNILVAAGSVLGFSKIQWKKLTTGLIGDE